MSDTSIYDQFIGWYAEEKEHFRNFAEYIRKSVTDHLSEYKILPAISTAREKDVESLRKKCRKLVESKDNPNSYVYKYNDPKNQITDMAGVRIVAYVDSDIPTICSIIERLFDIDSIKSIDKREKLEPNQVGYLSKHYIVSLNQNDREYNTYKDMKCEIQVLTVLQHAWAQIFHDRQYKPVGEKKIPIDLARKTNLVAGSLELLDNEIDVLVKQYNEFYEMLDNAEHQAFLDEIISEKNLKKYVAISMGHKYKFYDHKRVLDILAAFEIKTVRDFSHIFNEEIAISLSDMPIITIDHIVVYMIIATDPEKFFKNFGNEFKYTQSAVDILKKYIDTEKYMS